MDLNGKTQPKRHPSSPGVYTDAHADAHADAMGIAEAFIVKLGKGVLMNCPKLF